ncbi:hypothetical protein GGH91_004480 [Coemansia sp. RSA 2671]|nr:hypothetical protein GGH91_004480 [Coemansia sp. RSA 2671]
MSYQAVATQCPPSKHADSALGSLPSSTTKAANGGQLLASVEIHDSSDDDDNISSDIEFPVDAMLPPEMQGSTKDDSSAHTTLGNNEADDDIAFDSELTPDRAVQMIIGE